MCLSPTYLPGLLKAMFYFPSGTSATWGIYSPHPGLKASLSGWIFTDRNRTPISRCCPTAPAAFPSPWTWIKGGFVRGDPPRPGLRVWVKAEKRPENWGDDHPFTSYFDQKIWCLPMYWGFGPQPSHLGSILSHGHSWQLDDLGVPSGKLA